ncbi:MAG: septal ring lytic transglycosylase RlpA family protein [Ginsengibacter sp.]
MIKFFGILMVVLHSFSFGYSQKVVIPNKSHHKERKHPKEILRYGLASFYADKFRGSPTANGERYDPDKYTAACNTLPFNTRIRVTNLRNEKSVIVKINDRLHFRNKRIVDLSKAAAKKLGFISRGITKVKVEVLKDKDDGNS